MSHFLSGRRALIAWIGLILLIVVPWATFRGHSHWEKVQWIPFVTPPIRLRDIIANVLLYVPFGLFHARGQRARVHRLGLAVGGALVLSVATELAQVFSHSRFPSLTDVTCNVAGAWLGAVWAARWATSDAGVALKPSVARGSVGEPPEVSR